MLVPATLIWKPWLKSTGLTILITSWLYLLRKSRKSWKSRPNTRLVTSGWQQGRTVGVSDHTSGWMRLSTDISWCQAPLNLKNCPPHRRPLNKEQAAKELCDQIDQIDTIKITSTEKRLGENWGRMWLGKSVPWRF